MMQRDYTWAYTQAQLAQQLPPMSLPPQGAPAVGIMAPAAWGNPPPAAVIGLGPPVYKPSPLEPHADLHPLDPGTEPTFHDEMAGLFDCDTLLFSDTAIDEVDEPRGTIAAGGAGVHSVLDLATAPMGMPVLGRLPGLPLHLVLGARPGLPGAPALPMAPSAATAAAVAALVGPPLTSQILPSLGDVGGLPNSASGLLGALDDAGKLAEEVSGSGSGEASADGFTLPILSSEHASASPIKSVIGSEVDLKRIVDDVEEGSSEEDEEDRIPTTLQQQQQQQHRLRMAAAAAAGPLRPGGFVGGRVVQATPLTSSVHSGGRAPQQPSTSRGQISAASALGKRPASDLTEAAAAAAAAKRGGRRRIPSKRAVAAAFAESSDEEEDDLQYRSARRAFGNGAALVAAAAAGGGGSLLGASGVPARTSTRLQSRPAGHRLDSDYVTYDYDELEEPSSPGRSGNGVGGIGGASGQRRGNRNARAPAAAAAAATAAGGGSGAVRRAAPSRAGRRTVPLAAQRIRATSARHELKGRPSFAEIVEAGFMRPGPHRFHVGNVEVAAAVGEDGAIMYAGTRYRAISKFALVVLRERNPTRQSCDGWKEVAWNGEKLDALRVRVQAHARQVARQRVIQ